MHTNSGIVAASRIALLLALVFGTATRAQAQLFGLGAGTTASALSGDGSTVAGSTSSGFFQWSIATGVQPLTLATGSNIQSLSGNGAVVFGRNPSGGGFRFDGVATTLYSNVLPVAMSRDGLVMTGMDQFGSTAIRWTTANPTPTVLSPSSITQTDAIDADGGVIVGSALNPIPTGQAFRWTLGGGLAYIAAPSPYVSAAGAAVTADGSILCGSVGTTSGASSVAFRRGPSGTFEFLQPLPGDSYADVRAVTDDGGTIVGISRMVGPGTPVLWTGSSITTLVPYLTAHGLATTGWTFSSIRDISGDGSVLIGNGTLNGQSQAWVAVIPAPGGGVLIIAGLFAARRRQRRAWPESVALN